MSNLTPICRADAQSRRVFQQGLCTICGVEENHVFVHIAYSKEETFTPVPRGYSWRETPKQCWGKIRENKPDPPPSSVRPAISKEYEYRRPRKTQPPPAWALRVNILNSVPPSFPIPPDRSLVPGGEKNLQFSFSSSAELFWFQAVLVMPNLHEGRPLTLATRVTDPGSRGPDGRIRTRRNSNLCRSFTA